MELKYLNTFKTILEAGSFQKAAERLNYAQSTVTLQMQMLERELNVKLFEKIGRKMVLTQAGRELLPLIDRTLDTVREMESYGKRAGELTGSLRIAVPETLLAYRMPQVLRQFRQMAPNVKLSLLTPNCYEIREQVTGGTVDLGVHYDIGGYRTPVIVEKLKQYEFVLIGGAKLRRDEMDFISGHQRKRLCLLTDKSSYYYKKFEEYLKERDILMDEEIALSGTEAVKRLVSGNLGVAYLPRFSVEKELEEGTVRELPTAIENNRIGSVCAYHKNKWVTPAMELFIRLLMRQNNK